MQHRATAGMIHSGLGGWVELIKKQQQTTKQQCIIWSSWSNKDRTHHNKEPHQHYMHCTSHNYEVAQHYMHAGMITKNQNARPLFPTRSRFPLLSISWVRLFLVFSPSNTPTHMHTRTHRDTHTHTHTNLQTEERILDFDEINFRICLERNCGDNFFSLFLICQA